jgi:predicted ATPase/DNA-binding SARP family transcriptional activator
VIAPRDTPQVMEAPLQVRVLGPLELERAGRRIALGSRLQRRLLTVLVAAAGRTVSTDRLIDLLWGDDPPPAARNSLQSHVARLRATLGDADLIATRPPGYALDLGRIRLDAAAFDDAIGLARQQLDHDAAAAAGTLSAALATWRGHAHAEFADDVARADALRLEQLRVGARLLLAQVQLRAGEVLAAVDELSRLSAEEPLREDVVLAAAAALAAAGRTPESLDALRAFRGRLADEVGLDPSEAFAARERQLLRGEIPPGPLPMADPTTPPGPFSTSWRSEPVPVPAPRLGSPTVGRDRERERILAALDEAPIVTLVGPGGVGKTRLATTVAHHTRAGPSRSVAWADLARVTTTAGVTPAIAEALGVSGPESNDEALPTALARFRGLVVLDNCEHVLDAVADLVDRALAADGPVRLLATSRERLDVDGERVIAVAPLPVPEPRDADANDPAIALFLDRLHTAGGPEVSPGEAASVTAAVDGLPLAIELAAARAATLPVDDLLDRLGTDLDVLAGSRRRRGERHRTLRDVIAWSHDLLTEPDRVAFRRLSVFAAPFRLQDAEAVCADRTLPVTDVAGAVARLTERSMVTRVGPGRYRLLEPLRRFAADELARSDDAAATAHRHRDLALALAARADAAVAGPDEAAVVEELEAALPDLRAVHERALAAGDLATVARLTGRLYRFAYLQARPDVLAWGAALRDEVAGDVPGGDRRRALAAAVTAATWAARLDLAQQLSVLYEDRLAEVDPWEGALLAESLGDLHVNLGQLEQAAAAYDLNLRLADGLGHAGLRSLASASLSLVETFRGDLDEARRLAEEATALAATSGAASARSLAAYALGEALADRDPDAALRAYEAAVTEATSVRAWFYEGIARTADVALRGRHGDPADALRSYRSALQLWHDAGADGMALTTLRNLVVLLVRVGADHDALTLHEALTRLAPRASYGREAERLETALTAARERVDRSAVRGAAAPGELTTLLDATRFGLATVQSLIDR